jgi:subfamily B ATP-binding cassette protein HlyB/CyaB
MDKSPPYPLDTGLACLAMIARLHGIACDPEALRHRFGEASRPLDPPSLLRAARALGLRAGLRTPRAADPQTLPLPALAECHDGVWRILARASAERVLVQAGDTSQPAVLATEAFRTLWTGRVLLCARRALADGAGRGLAWLAGAAWPHRRVIAEVLVASVVIQLLALATPLFFQVVVDKVLVHRVATTLQVLVLGLVAVSLFEVLLTALRGWLLAHTTHRMDVLLGARLFAHLLRLPLAWFEARRVGDVVARVRELETLRAFATGAALTLLLDTGFTAVAFALMYAYSPQLCALVALSLPFYLLLSLVAAPLLRARAEETFRLGADNQALLVEAVSGVHTLKALALEPALGRRWETQLAAHAAAACRATLTGNWTAQCATLVNRLVTAGLLWFGAGSVIRGELSVGQLIAFNMFALRTGAPVLRLFQMWSDFQQARVAAARVAEVLAAPPEGCGTAGASLPRVQGRVCFEGVSFRYSAERAQALRAVDLAIEPGEVIGVVGRSGSGKSTLARLLQRLYLPERGRILVDGIDIALAEPASLRRQIGVVPQECFLFNGTVRENIAPGDPGMPLERIVRAATLAGAHEFVCALPLAYDTSLGEHAQLLSGGQRQRLAIARALLYDPRILVFDEATSALDYESEAAVTRNLGAICAGRTVLVIAHRLSALATCRRIVVLEAGRIVESGTPGELLARGGLYAGLHALQAGARAA